MRYAAIALVALGLATTLAPAQQQEWADKLFAKGGLSHDFGSVPHGALLPYRFTLTNIYAVPLTITGTRTSCGCVTVTPSAQVVQPKQTATIDITMDARRFVGAKSVSIFVTVGPQFTSTATLTVQANSRADVVFNPGQVNFGVVSGGQTPTQAIDVEYAGALDWKITGIANHDLPLETKIEEVYRRPGQIIEVKYKLSIALKPMAPPGAARWELLLQTNDPASPTLPLLVEANVQAVLTVAPARVSFGAAVLGETKELTVIVRGQGKAFRVMAVDGTAGGLTAELPPEAGALQRVVLKWTPTKAGDLKAELRFKTNLEAGAVAVVPVEGTATVP